MILSAWFGEALFSMGRLASLVHARDKFLADGGIIMPADVSLHLRYNS